MRLIFRLFTDPGHRWGVRRITACLNRDGYRRRSGLLWHPDKVRGIVNNPAVAGHLFYDEAAEKFGEPSGIRTLRPLIRRPFGANLNSLTRSNSIAIRRADVWSSLDYRVQGIVYGR